MATDDLPNYIDRGGDISLPGFFTLKGTQFAFRLKANGDKLQALCDKCLNLPNSNLSYSPVGEDIIISIINVIPTSRGDIEKKINVDIVSNQQPNIFTKIGENISFPPYRELSIAFPVEREESVSWFIPYIYLDSEAALVKGREEYGIPKNLAKITIDLNENKSLKKCEVENLTFDKKENTTAKMRTIIKIDELTESYTNDNQNPIWDEFLKTNFQTVSLKQLRDVEEGKACYQGIIEAEFNFDGSDEPTHLPHLYNVWVGDVFSDPIASDLGLNKGNSTTQGDITGYQQKVEGFVTTKLKFNIGKGTEVWRAKI
jgi:hypothetical protein